MYKLTKHEGFVTNTQTDWLIPINDPTNIDCKLYNLWLAEGNIPDPVDPDPVIIPTVVPMRQARLALLQNNLLATVNAAIAAGSEADQITWEYATEVDRNSPLVANMAAALNLTEQDLDNLFTLAATL